MKNIKIITLLIFSAFSLLNCQNKEMLKKIICLFIICLNFSITSSQTKKLKLSNGTEIAVVENLNVRAKLKLKKVINTEIIADLGYCGKSVLDSKNIKLVDMDKKIVVKMVKSKTAYEVKQDNNEFYIHSLYKSKLSCRPKRAVKLKVQILQLYDKINNLYYNLVLLK